MISITHIINPVLVKESSDLFKAQPITFETMRRAKEFAAGEVDIKLVTTQYEEDRTLIPDYFYKTNDLERSVLDIKDFKIKRKLPILKDILEAARTFDLNADYIIYTNTDIALMPFFYLFVLQKINQGYDGFAINRRTIDKNYSLQTLNEAYSDFGKKHWGYDCFVFKNENLKKFTLNNVSIGISKVGITLLANLICYSEKFTVFKENHVTFHLGDDQIWQNKSLNDYFIYNCNEAYQSYLALLEVNPNLIFNPIFKKHFDLLNKELFGEKKSGSIYHKIINKVKSKLK